MQLLVLLALLLTAKKTNARDFLSEVKPVVEQFGGEEIVNALKSAEEIADVLAAVRQMTDAESGGEREPLSFAQNGEKRDGRPFSDGEGRGEAKEEPSGISFPLAPISRIADRDITYSLSKYFSEQTEPGGRFDR